MVKLVVDNFSDEELVEGLNYCKKQKPIPEICKEIEKVIEERWLWVELIVSGKQV